MGDRGIELATPQHVEATHLASRTVEDNGASAIQLDLRYISFLFASMACAIVGETFRWEILMKFLIAVSVAVFFSLSVLAAPKVTIESVKVVVVEPGQETVTVTMPYWVAKGGAEVTDQLQVGEEKLPMKEIIQVIEKAPKLGKIMTIQEGTKKIEISIE